MTEQPPTSNPSPTPSDKDGSPSPRQTTGSASKSSATSGQSVPKDTPEEEGPPPFPLMSEEMVGAVMTMSSRILPELYRNGALDAATGLFNEAKRQKDKGIITMTVPIAMVLAPLLHSFMFAHASMSLAHYEGVDFTPQTDDKKED